MIDCLFKVVQITENHYEVKFEIISIDEVDYTIRSLLDLQQFSDPDDEALNIGISSAMWPLFGHVWPMSKILARMMIHEPITGKHILELGCGIGLPSLVIKQRGGDITASDYHPLARSFLLENTSLNSLPPIPFQTGGWDAAHPDAQKFDLIIGSDLLYEHQQIELLSSFIHQQANYPVEVIIVDPGRGQHRAFARAMEALEFQHTWTNLAHYPVQGSEPKGFILRFSRAD